MAKRTMLQDRAVVWAFAVALASATISLSLLLAAPQVAWAQDDALAVADANLSTQAD